MRKTRKTTNKPFGYHLIMDAAGCDPEAITKPRIREFIQTLITKIHMIAFGPTRIIKFGRGKIAGLTVMQFIEKSDITIHFLEQTNDAYFDLFSCKSFDPAVAIKLFKHYFNPIHIKTKFIKRQA
jgi:S-adenosylmethionine/arginine decarboxylase-like enzyme